VKTKTDWEGTGVIPDVPVPASEALLRARETLLAERLPQASDSLATRAIEWAVNAARGETRPAVVPTEQLAKYAGRFEEYTFSVRDGRLHAVNASRGGKTDVLVPINSRHFLLDRESQVEFVMGDEGDATAVRVLWNDGWVDRISRAK
jgi:hypothetical protein